MRSGAAVFIIVLGVLGPACASSRAAASSCSRRLSACSCRTCSLRSCSSSAMVVEYSSSRRPRSQSAVTTQDQQKIPRCTNCCLVFERKRKEERRRRKKKRLGRKCTLCYTTTAVCSRQEEVQPSNTYTLETEKNYTHGSDCKQVLPTTPESVTKLRSGKGLLVLPPTTPPKDFHPRNFNRYTLLCLKTLLQRVPLLKINTGKRTNEYRTKGVEKYKQFLFNNSKKYRQSLLINIKK